MHIALCDNRNCDDGGEVSRVWPFSKKGGREADDIRGGSQQ